MSVICPRCEEATITIDDLDERLRVYRGRLSQSQKQRLRDQRKRVVAMYKSSPLFTAESAESAEPAGTVITTTTTNGAKFPPCKRQCTSVETSATQQILELQQRNAILELQLHLARQELDTRREQCLRANAVLGEIFAESIHVRNHPHIKRALSLLRNPQEVLPPESLPLDDQLRVRTPVYTTTTINTATTTTTMSEPCSLSDDVLSFDGSMDSALSDFCLLEQNREMNNSLVNLPTPCAE